MSDSKARVKVYSTGTCPLCVKTKNLLSKWEILYDEARIDLDRDAYKEMGVITENARSVPQITIDGKWIGSFTELTMLHMDDELDHLMENES